MPFSSDFMFLSRRTERKPVAFTASKLRTASFLPLRRCQVPGRVMDARSAAVRADSVAAAPIPADARRRQTAILLPLRHCEKKFLTKCVEENSWIIEI